MENQAHGLPRVNHLRAAQARVRFLSIEPLIEDLGAFDLNGIHWVIVGGESGPGARPIDASWVERIRSQCQETGVLFFFKQWGGVQKKRAGRELSGRTFDDIPPRVAVPLPDSELRAKLIADAEETASLWHIEPRLVKLRRKALVGAHGTAVRVGVEGGVHRTI